MASALFQPPSPDPLAGAGRRLPPVPIDEDDGIHIASVARTESPAGPVFRVAVRWYDEGEWVTRDVELPADLAP